MGSTPALAQNAPIINRYSPRAPGWYGIRSRLQRSRPPPGGLFTCAFGTLDFRQFSMDNRYINRFTGLETLCISRWETPESLASESFRRKSS
jgi:hypothetical protein